MKKLKDSIPNLFDDDDPRIDYYIDKIRDSLKTTNQLFLANTLLILLMIFSFHLYHKGYVQQFSVLGQNIPNSIIIEKWVLVIPSIVFMINSFVGYLRVYQQEAIEWLLARHRKKEYESGLYRLTFPGNHILGMDLLTRTEKSRILFIPNLLVISATLLAPIYYISAHYYHLLKCDAGDFQTYFGASVCLVCILFGMYAISKSQKI